MNGLRNIFVQMFCVKTLNSALLTNAASPEGSYGAPVGWEQLRVFIQ